MQKQGLFLQKYKDITFLKSHQGHDPVSEGKNKNGADNARWDSGYNEIFGGEILFSSMVFKHCSRHVRKTRDSQSHACWACQPCAHDEQVWMRLRQVLTDLLHDRDEDEGSDGVGDKCWKDQEQYREYAQNAKCMQALDASFDMHCNVLQQAWWGDSVAESHPALR